MRRLARIPAAVALSCVIVALAGCSGASAPPPASVVPAQSVRAGRMTQEFAAVTAKTPQEAAAVRDFRRAVIIFDASEAGTGLVPGASQYVTGHALGNLTAAVTALAKSHTVSTGTSRIFDVAVTVDGKQAALAECDDVRANIDIVTTTGKAAPGFPPPPDQSFLKVAWLLRRTHGHWAVVLLGVGATNQNKTCQPGQPPVIIPDPPVTITGDGLLLREWTAADLPVLSELFDEESIDVWTPLAAPFDAQAARDYLARAERLRAAGHGLQLAITAGGPPLGEVLIFDGDEPGTAELAYAVGLAHRGQALGARAVRLALDFATARCGTAAFELKISPANPASQAVARANGFTLTAEPLSIRQRKGRTLEMATWRRPAP